MSDAATVETGQMGRIVYARLAPHEDLVRGVEKVCLAHGFKNALVRGALGSLIDGCLTRQGGAPQHSPGPAVEIVSLAGEVREQVGGALQARLSGVVANAEGHVYGGVFVAGLNPICITFEVTLEEWLPIAAV